MSFRSRAAGWALCALCGSAVADESRIVLRAGEGQALVTAHCITCHSLDYIEMSAPVMDRAGWEKSVKKMVEAMGAPVSPEDAPRIVDYLATHYAK